MSIVASATWKRLDTEGQDSCSLIRRDAGWTLSGCASFVHDGFDCRLPYSVDCDERWQTRRAHVHGFVGSRGLELNIERTLAGDWLLNGLVQPSAAGTLDLDLGFTPATNLIALRRLDFPQGAEVRAPAAYYLEFSFELGRIDQTYRRIDATTFAYASPGHSYAAEMTVHPSGFVVDYPGLWSGSVI